MIRAITFIASLITVSAFAPISRTTGSSLKMSFANEIGAQPPLGFWDPLGLLSGADQSRFDRLREVEIKHGKLCLNYNSNYFVKIFILKI